MKYLLQRGDGKYVAPDGYENSYVRSILMARVYESQEAAEANRCGNEDIVPATGGDWSA